MANNSKISNSPVTLAALEDMMKALKKELFEVLLFVNNVTKITLCDIDPITGKVVKDYFVESNMSKEDATKRQQFSKYLKQIGKAAEQRDDLYLSNIEVKTCHYVLNLRDSLGNEEKWLIVQQVGFGDEVQTSIVDAYKRHDLGMLPRETGLPVHINGHFALDHEARRNLWRDEATGYRSDWNNALLTDVIASCYLTLLEEVKRFYNLPITRDTEPVTLNCSKDALVKVIDDYEKLFPFGDFQNPYWETLVQSVYQGMDKKRLRLLPVVRSDASEGTSPNVQLAWLPPTGEGKSKAFFNNLGKHDCFASQPRRSVNQSKAEEEEKRRNERKTSFEEILLETGFNFVKLSLNVYEALQKSGVDSRCVSPSSVMEFYTTFNNEDPLCRIGSISVDVGETPFKNADGVTLVLKYCKDDVNFLENLPGLPLLVTQDNRLREFSSCDPKFLSRYLDILPQCREMFVDNHVRIQIFDDALSPKSPVFKCFGVQEFAANLHRTLPPSISVAMGT
ncbi:hypothetical protein OS493_010862 [Desmophyllum pertusum]|uniref:Uncharacterized protein n=1 Tax=Desmophyllum pertusum TaxID=174260 RepID=A0A9W9ZEP7_9CNID|nr:hypothetical protein OS493_010862 [Desmophyllum pertusum]